MSKDIEMGEKLNQQNLELGAKVGGYNKKLESSRLQTKKDQGGGSPRPAPLDGHTTNSTKGGGVIGGGDKQPQSWP